MHRVTSTVTYGCRADYNKLDDWQRKANPWTVELRYKGRRLTTDFFTGQLCTKDPTTADVLGCLLSDASGVDDGFDEWCGNFGYDADSRKAEATYKACVKVGRDLRRIFGDDFEDFRDLYLDEAGLSARCI